MINKKSVQKFASYCERKQRKPQFKKKQEYFRDGLAGAAFVDGRTQIMTETCGLILNKEIPDLVMVRNYELTPNAYKLFSQYRDKVEQFSNPYSRELEYDLEQIKIDLRDKVNSTVTFGLSKFPSDQFIMLVECFKHPKLHIDLDSQFQMLFIEDDDGFGLICPMRY